MFFFLLKFTYLDDNERLKPFLTSTLIMENLACLNKILGAYALVLTVVGTFLSILSYLICKQIKKKNVTVFFMSSLSICSIFTLYFWNLDNFFKEIFNIDLLNLNYWLCKIGSFIQFVSLQMCSWILVCLLLFWLNCISNPILSPIILYTTGETGTTSLTLLNKGLM